MCVNVDQCLQIETLENRNTTKGPLAVKKEIVSYFDKIQGMKS